MAIGDDSPGGEVALWARWFESAEPEIREALIARYVPYATALAAKLYAVRGVREVEFQEYRQFAMVGLVQAVDRFRPDGGAQFKTFAMQRIRGAILNGLQHLSERHEQNAAQRRIALERAGSLKASSLSLGDPERLLEQLQAIGMGLALGVLLEGTGMLADGEHAVPDTGYEQVEVAQLRRHLWEMAKKLEGRERQVVLMHYEEGRSFTEIAETLRLTKGRISQIHGAAVNRLRALVTRAARCDVAY